MLTIFVTANIITLYVAGDSSPRLVNEEYYKRGEDYEENMLKRRARDPGWKMEIQAPDFVDVDVESTFRFTVTSKEGEPVEPDAVTFYAYRPSDGSYDFSLPMDQVAPGQYKVVASFPLKGVWDILVAAKQGEDEYQAAYDFSAGVK
jgi:nitrogen fixation protein FixH